MPTDPVVFATQNTPAAMPEGPAWCEDLRHGLSFSAQFVLSGNLRDLFWRPDNRGGHYVDLETALRGTLRRQGIAALLVHDPRDGLRLSGPANAELERFLVRAGFEPGETADTPEALAELIGRAAALRELPLALMIDYAGQTLEMVWPQRDIPLVAADKAARRPLAARPQGLAKAPHRNPLIWVADLPEAFPDWFTAAGGLRHVTVERPGLETRLAFATTLADRFADAGQITPQARQAQLERFALMSAGDSLTTMKAIAQLAEHERIGLTDIGDAVRLHRTGRRRNPWSSPVLRKRMAHARETLADRIKGQTHAIDKTLDILMRSITGLSGAQSAGGLNRPRGVLFFAGPTGVGKTELAKAVTELLFGDEGACRRFDMSEFMEESSIARLIGPPPGLPGHERGGELTRTLAEHPFSVFLFDEIEKAHPRILDTFLQILDEGRITDGRGVTRYFSEALIIFTSNIGMFGGAKSMNMGMSILPSDPYDALDRKILDAVQAHFRYDLQRPELINRLGQNVVSFDFIHPISERAIFTAAITRVCERVRETHGVEVVLAPEARAALDDLCTRDVFDGGRGIGNRVETHFVNPLARELFGNPSRTRIVVTAVEVTGDRAILRCT